MYRSFGDQIINTIKQQKYCRNKALFVYFMNKSKDCITQQSTKYTMLRQINQALLNY